LAFDSQIGERTGLLVCELMRPHYVKKL